MAEITVGGLGLVALISLFQTCHRAYEVFIRSAKTLGRDAHLLGVHLEVERQKLRLWGQYLGISRSQQCRLLRAESADTQAFVVKLLDSIKALLDDIDVITVRYGVTIVEEGADLAPAPEFGLGDLDLEDIRTCAAVQVAQIKRTKTERSIVASTSRLSKLRWALGDNIRLKSLVDDLRKLTDDLWVALPRNKWLLLAKGLPSFVLPEILDQATLAEVKGSAGQHQTTELLAACSDLRRTALAATANESSASFGDDLRIPSSQVTVHTGSIFGDPTDANPQRHIASVAKADGTTAVAILEWRYVDESFSWGDKKIIRSRIKALAVLLNTERRSEFGLLKCIGFFEDERCVTERYGLLFNHSTFTLPPSIPSSVNPSTFQPQPRSLYEYIGASTLPPLLGDRFRIATMLCNIVLQIHASSWLHKAIRSSNILFFPCAPYASPTDLEISHPFLMGFDFSRPDRPNAPSLELPGDRTCNDYRHPSLWPSHGAGSAPRYRKQHDIYALGVVLLEIGNWRSVGKLSDDYRDMRRPLIWRDHLLTCAKQLGHRCGKVYQEVVETCLTGQFVEHDPLGKSTGYEEDEAGFEQSFLFDVFYKLGKCYA